MTFGPRKEKIYKVKINKKQKRKALFMALSSKINDKEMALLDKFEIGEVKTKKMAGILDMFSKAVWGNSRLKKTLVVLPQSDRKILLSTRNIPAAKIISADSLNIYDLLAYKYLIMPKDAIGIIEKTYKM